MSSEKARRGNPHAPVRWFHGTSLAAGQTIVKEGRVQAPMKVASHYSGKRSWTAPVEGMVYVTSSVRSALDYAHTRNHFDDKAARAKSSGAVIEVELEEPCQVDEDVLGKEIFAAFWLDNALDQIFRRFGFNRSTLRPEYGGIGLSATVKAFDQGKLATLERDPFREPLRAEDIERMKEEIAAVRAPAARGQQVLDAVPERLRARWKDARSGQAAEARIGKQAAAALPADVMDDLSAQRSTEHLACRGAKVVRAWKLAPGVRGKNFDTEEEARRALEGSEVLSASPARKSPRKANPTPAKTLESAPGAGELEMASNLVAVLGAKDALTFARGQAARKKSTFWTAVIAALAESPAKTRKAPATVLLFSYGSNGAKQLAERLGHPVKATRGYAADWRRAFVGHSKRWGGAPATLLPARGSTVFGTLSEVTAADLEALDPYEGVPRVYQRHEVLVRSPDFPGEKSAVAYLATSREEGKPTPEYMAAIQENLSAWVLPSKDVQRLERVVKEAQATIDNAYWAFTRQARAKPPSVAVPEAYRQLNEAVLLLRADRQASKHVDVQMPAEWASRSVSH